MPLSKSCHCFSFCLLPLKSQGALSFSHLTVTASLAHATRAVPMVTRLYRQLRAETLSPPIPSGVERTSAFMFLYARGGYKSATTHPHTISALHGTCQHCPGTLLAPHIATEGQSFLYSTSPQINTSLNFLIHCIVVGEMRHLRA